VATSLGDALPHGAPHVRTHLGNVATTAGGVAIGALLGVTIGSLVTYYIQHHLQLQHGQVSGRVVDCHGGALAAAEVVLVGEYGPAANAVFSTRTAPDGSFSMEVPPGLYSGTVAAPSGPQLPASIVQVDSGGHAIVAWSGCVAA